MEKVVAHQRGSERRTRQNTVAPYDNVNTVRQRILDLVKEVRVLDPALCRAFIRERQKRDIDTYDEVWEGVYVVPAQPTNPHQDLVTDLSGVLFTVIKLEGRGRVHAGANVSDRRKDWEFNHRAPDVVVVLQAGQAVDCGTHWLGGPDFIVEVRSPYDATEEKMPFYGRIGVREMLVIQRDTRELRLYRHDGRQLVPVEPSAFEGGKWLVSEVVPLAFRRRVQKGVPKTEVRRTDAAPGGWTV